MSLVCQSYKKEVKVRLNHHNSILFAMGLAVSNSFLAAFSAGTIFGITSTYFLIKFKNKDPLIPTAVPIEERFEVNSPDMSYQP